MAIKKSKTNKTVNVKEIVKDIGYRYGGVVGDKFFLDNVG